MENSSPPDLADERPAEQQPPAEPPAGMPGPVPTDFGRNVWVVLIILGVVILAWVLSVAGHIGSSGAADAGPQAAPPQARAEPQRMAVPMPAPPLTYQIVGTGRTCILASEPLRLSPGGATYRLPRLFDVTEQAAPFEPPQLVRIPGRRADQIPPLTIEPAGAEFRPANEVDRLRADNRVVVVSDGQTERAYPVRALRACLGVNDRFGETPVFVCWSALTQTARCLVAQAQDGQIDWRDAGLTYQGNNVLYDGQSGSLWDSFSGACLAGPLAGRTAGVWPTAVWPWTQWKALHPETPTLTAVLAPDLLPDQTVYSTERLTAVDVYLQAVRPESAPGDAQQTSAALGPKAFVLGITVGAEARAYPLGKLAETAAEVVADSVGGRAVEVHVTSWRTGYATSNGELLDAPVMLWFAWQDIHPQTDVYAAASPSASMPVGTD